MTKEENLKVIREVIKKMSTSLDASVNSDNQEYYSFELDCDSLDDYNNIDIRDSQEFSEIFQKLEILEGPVLYWFEIVSNTSTELIRSKMIEYSKIETAKKTPALNKRYELSSKCLYVGKVKKAFWGRVIQHLGFYRVQRTQGLQLFYWSKRIDLKLKVHAIKLDQSMGDLISVVELEMARRLKPITGKHR